MDPSTTPEKDICRWNFLLYLFCAAVFFAVPVTKPRVTSMDRCLRLLTPKSSALFSAVDAVSKKDLDRPGGILDTPREALLLLNRSGNPPVQPKLFEDLIDFVDPMEDLWLMRLEYLNFCVSSSSSLSAAVSGSSMYPRSVGLMWMGEDVSLSWHSFALQLLQL